MAQPPDSSPDALRQRSSASGRVEEAYSRAVQAFKSGDYGRSLALFQSLGTLPNGSAYRLKGLMGQVRVHQHLGQTDRARAICLGLAKSSSSAVRQWAQAALVAMPPAQGAKASPTVQRAADASGFVPLAANAQPPLAFDPPIASPPPTPNTAEEGNAGEASVVGSLFHFQRLNRDAEAQPLESSQALPSHAKEMSGPAVQTADSTAAGSKPRGYGPAPRVTLPRLPERPLGLWLGQGMTAIAVVWAISWGCQALLRIGDRALGWVRLGLPGAGQSPTPWVIGVLAVLLFANPWIFDYLLGRWYDQRPLSTRQLQNDQPEALQQLRQVCRQRGWQMPDLRVIPTPAPLCFSYGWRAANMRIVVSQGVLNQLSAEAVVALYGYELARAVNGSLAVLSWVSLLLLLLEQGHRCLARWADRSPLPLAKNSLGLLASALYGLFWLLRQISLWLSRLTADWGDRRALALTRPPGHLSSGLWHYAGAIATSLSQRGTPHPLHTSLELIMPVGYRQALSLGSLLAEDAAAVAQQTVMALDSANPYRQWLRVSASHRPLGERLHRMHPWVGQPPVAADPAAAAAVNFSLPPLLLQKAPLFGLLGGASLAMGLWFLGGVVQYLGWQRLSWLYQDSSLVTGGVGLGLGLGLLLRINDLFPDPTAPAGHSPAPQNQTVAELMLRCQPLPVQGQPVALRGTLRGETGVANWGCQQLYLDDGSGTVRLCHPVPLGSVQGVGQQQHPCRWIGRRATVTGWGRYGGGMLWVDIDRVQLDNQRQTFRAYGPPWATAISLGTSLMGIWAIFRGG